MTDKEIVSLPAIPAFRDDALLPCYVPGSTEPAQKMTGAQLREYAERAAANVKKGDKGDKGDPGDVSSVNGVRPDTKGNVTITPAQIGALPLNGSAAMTGILNLKPAGMDGYSQIYKNATSDNADYGTVFTDRNAAGKTATLKLRASADQARVILNGVEHDILHTGNKPSASYSGTGSAEEWSLDTGGIGHLVYIFNSYNSTNALVGYNGAIVWNNTGTTFKVLNSTAAKFRNGVLTIATNDATVNANLSLKYSYQVL